MNTRTYVGLAQWRALCALWTFGEAGITVSWVNGEIERRGSGSNYGRVLAALIDQRMVRHACPEDEHKIREACLVAITERGQEARLDQRGRKAVLAEWQTAPR